MQAVNFISTTGAGTESRGRGHRRGHGGRGCGGGRGHGGQRRGRGGRNHCDRHDGGPYTVCYFNK